MSGAGESPKPQAGAPAGGDPAMDDILASIRRILNEDEAAPGATAVAGAAAPAGSPEEPIELTEAMMVQPSAPAMPASDPAPSLAAAEEPATPPDAGALVAPTVAAATTAAVGKLLRAVAQERATPVHRGGPTIEDVVREELRPLLKEWLDQHLPPLVERLVRVEIERVVGRGLP